MPFIMTNIPDRVKILPNKITKEKVEVGYKDVRTKYIDFVTKYNGSKTAGTIAISSVDLDALRKLNTLWKTATVDSKCFFEMEELHDQLSGKFPDTAEAVSIAWNDYVKNWSDVRSFSDRSNRKPRLGKHLMRPARSFINYLMK